MCWSIEGSANKENLKFVGLFIIILQLINLKKREQQMTLVSLMRIGFVIRTSQCSVAHLIYLYWVTSLLSWETCDQSSWWPCTYRMIDVFICLCFCFPFNYLSSLLTWQNMSELLYSLFIFRSALKIYNQIELCKVMAWNFVRFSWNGFCKLLERFDARKKLV